MWRTGATSEKCFTHYFAKILFLVIILGLINEWKPAKFALNYFSGHVSWHGVTSAEQSNSAEFSSVSQTHFQSQKRTLSSVFPNPLATFWMRRRTVWSLVLSYWSMQQLANSFKLQTCKESHVHDNVLVLLPNCEYTYQKSLFRFFEDFMMVQGRLYVEI